MARKGFFFGIKEGDRRAQWPASHAAMGRAWSATEYIARTSKLAAELAHAKGEGTAVYWVWCLTIELVISLLIMT